MRIGIVGAGQLGQMLGFAARDLGMHCTFIDPSPNPPAAACGQVIQAAFDDDDALSALAAACDIVTYEFENVPVEALERISEQDPLGRGRRPDPQPVDREQVRPGGGEADLAGGQRRVAYAEHLVSVDRYGEVVAKRSALDVEPLPEGHLHRVGS